MEGEKWGRRIRAFRKLKGYTRYCEEIVPFRVGRSRTGTATLLRHFYCVAEILNFH
jgi:hypothetical protein